MSEFIVTARKWRPMKFEDVAGQRHVIVTLRNALSTGRIAHAYIFSGPRGVGKTTTARLLAKAVNCLSPVDLNPDNACEICTEITEGRSFDVQEIDGASNRSVEDIRNLREAVRYAPVKGRYKVYIIDEVHMLTKEAFNALLKTLEEPPPHILFIFATTELQKVPATILSRCQRFDFRRIPTGEIHRNLAGIAQQEGLVVDDEALLLIARRADGSLRDAQSLFDQVIALCGRTVTHAAMLEALNIVDEDYFFRVTSLMGTQDPAGGLALVEDLMSHGYDLREFLVGLIEHFRNLLVAKATGKLELIDASDVLRKRYGEVAAQFSIGDLLRAQRHVSATEMSLSRTAQARFRLEADIVQLVTMPRSVDLGTLIEGLDELKKKLAGERQLETPETGPRQQPSPSPVAPVRRVPPPPSVSVPPRAVPPPVSPAMRPVPSAGVSENEVRSRWTEFVAEVSRAKISVGTVLGSTTFLGVQEGILRIGCVDEFQVASVERNREVLAGIFHAVFHVHVRVTGERIVSGESAVHPPAGADDEHPIIKALKRELGAEPI
jgi:DNA polymerase-3 subunit gamma/tau